METEPIARSEKYRLNLETFGLPACLHLPIAAASVAVLEPSVGTVLDRRASRAGRTNAVLLAAHAPPPETAGVSLWHHPEAAA